MLKKRSGALPPVIQRKPISHSILLIFFLSKSKNGKASSELTNYYPDQTGMIKNNKKTNPIYFNPSFHSSFVFPRTLCIENLASFLFKGEQLWNSCLMFLLWKQRAEGKKVGKTDFRETSMDDLQPTNFPNKASWTRGSEDTRQMPFFHYFVSMILFYVTRKHFSLYTVPSMSLYQNKIIFHII